MGKETTKFEKDRWKFMIGTKVYKLWSGTSQKNELTGQVAIQPGFYLKFTEEFEGGPISCDVEKQVDDYVNNLVSSGKLNGEGTIKKERDALMRRAINFIKNHPDYKVGMIVPYVPPQLRQRDQLAEGLRNLGYDIPPEQLEQFKIGGSNGDEVGNRDGSAGQDLQDGGRDSAASDMAKTGN